MTCLRFGRVFLLAALVAVQGFSEIPHVQAVFAQAVERPPTAVLVPATPISFGTGTDSNSPAVWERLNGLPTLFLFTSAGWPTRRAGPQVNTLTDYGRIEFTDPGPIHGIWMEAIVADVDGTWYGYYHNELPAEICGDTERTMPRIGAARSRNFGVTWEDLGVILEAPAGWHDCSSTNRYFVGGVGDFSVVLDPEAQNLYFFFSQYGNREQTQGVAVARLAWANRDRPAGRISVWWRGTTWVPARRLRTNGERAGYAYPAGVPIYRATDQWHDDESVDAFWGPSVHWNTYLQQYVMLLNRAQDTTWRQEGIYVAFAKSLSDPAGWSTPHRLLGGGQWYPQVIGLEPGVGTDKVAGERARFFMGGRSQYFIQFAR
jgi:hypothetical protein